MTLISPVVFTLVFVHQHFSQHDARTNSRVYPTNVRCSAETFLTVPSEQEKNNYAKTHFAVISGHTGFVLSSVLLV